MYYYYIGSEYHYYRKSAPNYYYRLGTNQPYEEFFSIFIREEERWAAFDLIGEVKSNPETRLFILQDPNSDYRFTLRVPNANLATCGLALPHIEGALFLLPHSEPKLATKIEPESRPEPELQRTKPPSSRENAESEELPNYTPEQRKALEVHRDRLQQRSFQHRILSYPYALFFGKHKGYSRDAKVTAINQFLGEQEGEADMDVLNQGRTGNILKGP